MVTKKPFNEFSFLITNDDGIRSTKLQTLAKIALMLSDNVKIVCPMNDMSGTGTSMSFNKPLSFWRHHTKNVETWIVKGTPADCVILAKRNPVIFYDPIAPHIVLSGINVGDNTGRTFMYSGTVGAAMVASIEQSVAIAVSLADDGFPEMLDEKSLMQLIHDILVKILPYQLKTLKKYGNCSVLSINLPNQQPRGICLSRHCSSILMPNWVSDEYLEGGINIADPKLSPTPFELHARTSPISENRDVSLLREGFVTITPIKSFDITDYSLIKKNPWNFIVEKE